MNASCLGVSHRRSHFRNTGRVEGRRKYNQAALVASVLFLRWPFLSPRSATDQRHSQIIHHSVFCFAKLAFLARKQRICCIGSGYQHVCCCIRALVREKHGSSPACCAGQVPAWGAACAVKDSFQIATEIHLTLSSR